MPNRPSSQRPIGVFDSGAGGLTVARALMDLLPDERILYFGDTARGPYGPRPLSEVRRFTIEIVEHLRAATVKTVVAACNTASAATLEQDPPEFEVPVVGVVGPAVRAAARATRSGRIGVIGTVGTIESGAYDRALAAVDDGTKLFSAACPRFVDLVEAGRTTDGEVLDVAHRYLMPLAAAQVDTLILGCTHYPLLTGVISYVMGADVVLISSAEETARAVFASLVDDDLLAPHQPTPPEHRFVTTGDALAFSRVAARFLGPRLSEVHGVPVTLLEETP